MTQPSPYELRALAEIRAWHNPVPGWFGRTLKLVNAPLDWAGDVVMNTPGVGWAIQKSVGGLVLLLNDVAQWSVRAGAIHEEFRHAGHTGIQSSSDILKLDLSEVDSVIGWLDAKYKSAAATEGGVTGTLGLPGIPADVVALIGLNLRAIGEYAYCGFEASRQQERLYAVNVLGLASSSADGAKAVAMAELVKIAKDVAQKRAWKELQQHTFVKILQQLAKSLGLRLTKAKLAQVVPVTGAVVGAGFNTYFTAKVCDAAYHLYRHRFLVAKYGEKWI